MVVFDLDGTLVNAAAKQGLCLRAAAQAYGVSLDPADLWRLKREGASNRDALLSGGADPGRIERICALWLETIETPYWATYDTLVQDGLSSLRRLRGIGVATVLLTARRHHHWLHQQLHGLRLLPLFDQVFCVSPRSAAQEKATILRRLSPTVFLGDTESDFAAASEAGVPFRAVTTGLRSSGFLKSRGIAPLHDTLTEALDDVRLGGCGGAQS